MTLKPDFICQCQVQTPLQPEGKPPGEDSGLCSHCGGVYDERLYEMRLRQYNFGFHWGSVHDYLMEVSPRYRDAPSG